MTGINRYNLIPLLQEKGHKFNFHFDMDGVLVDFYNDVRNLPEKYVDYFDNDRFKFWESIEKDFGSSFWENLNIKIDGISLFNLVCFTIPVKQVSILSAYPSFGIKNPQCCIDGKIAWLKKYNIENDKHFCMSKDKCFQADKDSILIDDSEKNIESWNKMGGFGILYTDQGSVFRELIHILENN